MKAWFGPLVSLGIALGGVAAAWADLTADSRETKRRVTTVEQRQAEDRTDARRDQREIKTDIKDTKRDVQTILLKLESIQAEQKAAARR